MNKFWRFILIGLGRFDFEAEEKAKKEKALKTRQLLKLTTQHHHDVYKRLCDEAIEKSSVIIAKRKEEVATRNSTCPACGSKNVVDKMMHAGSTTFAVNRCKTCENEWHKLQPITERPNKTDLLRKARLELTHLAHEDFDALTQADLDLYKNEWKGIPLAVFEQLVRDNSMVSNLSIKFYLKHFNVKFMHNLGITELEEAGYDVGSSV